MFKIIEKKSNIELFPNPIDGLYSVKELSHYKFEYHATDGSLDNNSIVLLEDEPINSKIIINNGVLKLESKGERIFQDHFGFASLRINKKVIASFNITINKLKKQEIEDIFVYLWERENKVFHNFLSRSSIKADISDNENSYSLTSKFLIFVEKFYTVFYQNLYNFKKKPQSVLRTEKMVVPYTASAITVSSVEWLLSNLDEVMFDPSFAHHPDSIRIENTYGYLEQIQTDLKIVSFNVYENCIILGAFDKILFILAALKKELLLKVNLEEAPYSYGDQVDFRDLKKVTFLVLDRRIKESRKKIIMLHRKYQDIFFDAVPTISKPKLTSAFSRKIHYQVAFKLVKKLWNHNNLNLGNELNLLSIKKLHKLYEIYNLHRLIEELESVLNLELFNKEVKSYDKDGIINHIEYIGKDVVLKLFYELKYFKRNKNNVELIRIDKQGKGSNYEPDYILEISNLEEKKYFIFDAKYTSSQYVDRNLSEIIMKYIIGTGLQNNPYKKINFLGLLYPGEITDSKISDGFYPQIWILSSKPKSEQELKRRLEDILLKNIPSSYLN